MAFLEVNFKVSGLGQCMSMNVILPHAKEERDEPHSVSAEDSYPTLYLLHGMSDDHTSWMRNTSLERYAASRRLAIVMPSTYLGWYTDMHYGYPYRTYMGEELPKICRSLFPGMSQKREDTYVAGLSMGGYGSLALALTYPETFSIAAPMSAAFDPKCLYSPDNNYFLDIFGEIDQFDGSKNDLFHLAKANKEAGKPAPEIYIGCGTSDGLLEDNRRMQAHLKNLGYDVTYSESPGAHEWAYWDREIQKVLDYIDSRRKPNF